MGGAESQRHTHKRENAQNWKQKQIDRANVQLVYDGPSDKKQSKRARSLTIRLVIIKAPPFSLFLQLLLLLSSPRTTHHQLS